MKKQTKLHSIKLLSLAMVAALIIIIGTTFSASAQDQPAFKVGDRVEAIAYGTTWRKATVIEVRLRGDGEIGFYVVREDGSGWEFIPPGKQMRHLKDGGENNTAAGKENQTAGADKKDEKKENASGYKVGDRIKASPLFRKEDEYYESCTVMEKLDERSYSVRCDPKGAADFVNYVVRTDFMRPWADATAAPTFDCSFDQPAGKITENSPATAATFKRVMYEQEAKNAKLRVGLQFQVFELGKAYKNILTGNSLPREGAPINAMIYPVKTKYTVCHETSGEYNNLATYESKHVCIKDSFGGWNCTTTGGFRSLTRINVPKD